MTAAGTAGTPGAPRPVSQARVGGDQALVRTMEMSLGTTNRVMKGPRGRFVVESSDPSIPLDRVPYFGQDLRKLGGVAAAMAALLAGGAWLIPQLIK